MCVRGMWPVSKREYAWCLARVSLGVSMKILNELTVPSVCVYVAPAGRLAPACVV